jgi:hypothetical protein
MLPADFSIPENVDVRCSIDPSYTAGPQSDSSALCAGGLERSDGENDSPFILLDAVSGRFRGWSLVDQTISFFNVWKPRYFILEVAGGKPSDLFIDALNREADSQNIVLPNMRTVVPRNIKWSKARRVARLKTDLLDRGLLKIRRGRFIDQLLREVEAFDFTRSDNQSREDGIIDSLSRLVGFN